MKQRVLIVEDEAIVADELQYQLEQLGYEIVGIADCGRDAIHLAEERTPDIVLMDIQLQGKMTGIEAAQIIQRQSDVNIIFVTAFAAMLARDASRMTTPGICLSKPFSLVQLRTALATVSSRSNDAQQP